jgi:hypothetical protein
VAPVTPDILTDDIDNPVIIPGEFTEVRVEPVLD